MKHPRLIVELVLLVLCLGLIGWQQRTISRLRRGQAEADRQGQAGLRVVRVVPSGESAAGATGAVGPPRTRHDGDAEAKQTDLASLRDRLRVAEERNRTLEVTRSSLEQHRMAIDLAVLSSFESGALASDGPPPSPDTTGRLASGEPASWSGLQAVGAPDTPEAGDLVTAWAPRSQDGGEEWLHLTYATPVDVAQVNVHETFNPGAVSRVAAVMPDGSETVLWEGMEPPEEAPVEVGFPVPPGIRSDQIKVYLETARVPGWNEIDAVELVGADGSRQWATAAAASSYYGDTRGR